MNKLLSSILLVVVTVFNHTAAAKNELTFLTWSEYMDPDILQEFEAKFKTKVNMIYFESDDARSDLLIQTEGKGYDLIMSDGISIEQYKKSGWLAPIDINAVPNLKYINKKWLTMFEAANGYAAPYFWGTLGIAYRSDMVKGDIDSWMHLFQPSQEMRGKIAMILNSRDVIGAALKALGYSVNSTDKDEIKKAADLLMSQKPFVKDYSYINLDETSALVKGDIVMAMAYSGDALMLSDIDERIKYVVPKEGSNIWIDYLLVSKYSKNKSLAYAFINFMNEPDIAARQAQYVYYATPNKKAEELLPKNFLSDPVIYPSKEIIDKSESYKRLSGRITRYRNQVFSEVTN